MEEDATESVKKRDWCGNREGGGRYVLKYWKKLKIDSDSVELRSDQREGKEDMGGKDRCHVL